MNVRIEATVGGVRIRPAEVLAPESTDDDTPSASALRRGKATGRGAELAHELAARKAAGAVVTVLEGGREHEDVLLASWLVTNTIQFGTDGTLTVQKLFP